MHIQELLDTKKKSIITIQPNDTIRDALYILNKEHIGVLIVLTDQSQLTGIVSERDILNHIEKTSLDEKVSKIMTPADQVIFAYETDSVEYAMNIFTQNKIRHLPVYKGKQLTGIISIGDAVKGVLSEKLAENKLLHEYIAGPYPV